MSVFTSRKVVRKVAEQKRCTCRKCMQANSRVRERGLQDEDRSIAVARVRERRAAYSPHNRSILSFIDSHTTYVLPRGFTMLHVLLSRTCQPWSEGSRSLVTMTTKHNPTKCRTYNCLLENCYIAWWIDIKILLRVCNKRHEDEYIKAPRNRRKCSSKNEDFFKIVDRRTKNLQCHSLFFLF